MKKNRALVVVCLVACGSPSGPLPMTQLEMHAVPMIVDQCEDGLDAWTVNVHETGEHHTSPCDAPILLSVLQPNEHYTLEISGYARDGLCWSGTCAVTARPGLGLAECVGAVESECRRDRER